MCLLSMFLGGIGGLNHVSFMDVFEHGTCRLVERSYNYRDSEIDIQVWWHKMFHNRLSYGMSKTFIIYMYLHVISWWRRNRNHWVHSKLCENVLSIHLQNDKSNLVTFFRKLFPTEVQINDKLWDIYCSCLK